MDAATSERLLKFFDDAEKLILEHQQCLDKARLMREEIESLKKEIEIIRRTSVSRIELAELYRAAQDTVNRYTHPLQMHGIRIAFGAIEQYIQRRAAAKDKP